MPTNQTSGLRPPVPGDITSTQSDEQLATCNAYSKDGDVTAPLVYVNYGHEEDYEELTRHGVSVKGPIVIVQYGETWRGLKPKFAAEHGAIGCLIYSDPNDDGFGDAKPVYDAFAKITGSTYPDEWVIRGNHHAAWDGEEPMLLGSTEWVEKHEADLKKAVVYINSDGNERGFLGASRSHTLEHFVNTVAKDIKDTDFAYGRALAETMGTG